MDQITLSWGEIWTAAIVGCMRQISNLKDRLHHKYGANNALSWQMHIEGAMGEAAVAKLLDRWWSGALGDRTAADVGELQVRTTSRRTGRLIVHPGERDLDIFILVICDPPRFMVPGWIYGSDAKSELFWTDPQGGRPAYFVPQNRLKPMELLLHQEPVC